MGAGAEQVRLSYSISANRWVECMDLMRLLRSLEEFLYELVGWLVFYPRTFWRIVWHPGAIARYTRIELAKEREEQFGDTISPVLMLVLSVIIAHALELALKLPLPVTANPVGQLLFGSEQGLLLTRSAFYSVLSLGAALGTLRETRQPITRAKLREPFSVQAFLVCPFLVLHSIGEQLSRMADTRYWGIVLVVLAAVWYVAARVIAYRAINGGRWGRAFVLVLRAFLLTYFALLLIFALLLA